MCKRFIEFTQLPTQALSALAFLKTLFLNVSLQRQKQIEKYQLLLVFLSLDQCIFVFGTH